MKFADPRKKSESLCFKPATQRNLKHKAPSVRALIESLTWLFLNMVTGVVLFLSNRYLFLVKRGFSSEYHLEHGDIWDKSS